MTAMRECAPALSLPFCLQYESSFIDDGREGKPAGQRRRIVEVGMPQSASSLHASMHARCLAWVVAGLATSRWTADNAPCAPCMQSFPEHSAAPRCPAR